RRQRVSPLGRSCVDRLLHVSVFPHDARLVVLALVPLARSLGPHAPLARPAALHRRGHALAPRDRAAANRMMHVTWGRCSKTPTQQRLVVTEGGNTGPLLASAGQPTTRVNAGRNDG